MNLLSYIYPQELERLSTKYNNDIRVQIEKGQPKLLVNGSRQSGTYIHDLWVYAIKKLGVQKVKNILVLGVAGGTVIKLFPEAHIIGVDIDPEMIRIGNTYFGLDKIKNLTLVEADAQTYQPKDTYNLIIIDLFSGRNIPEFVLSKEFHKKIKRMLVKNGFVLINYLREKEYGQKAEILEKIVKDIYHDVRTVDRYNNRFFMLK